MLVVVVGVFEDFIEEEEGLQFWWLMVSGIFYGFNDEFQVFEFGIKGGSVFLKGILCVYVCVYLQGWEGYVMGINWGVGYSECYIQAYCF